MANTLFTSDLRCPQAIVRLQFVPVIGRFVPRLCNEARLCQPGFERRKLRKLGVLKNFRLLDKAFATDFGKLTLLCSFEGLRGAKS